MLIDMQRFREGFHGTDYKIGRFYQRAFGRRRVILMAAPVWVRDDFGLMALFSAGLDLWVPPWASGESAFIEEDQPLDVVDEVDHADFRPGPGDTDGTDEQVHPVLLSGKDMLHARPDL